MADLPDDILSTVLQHLDGKDTLAVADTCHRMRQLLTQPHHANQLCTVLHRLVPPAANPYHRADHEKAAGKVFALLRGSGPKSLFASLHVLDLVSYAITADMLEELVQRFPKLQTIRVRHAALQRIPENIFASPFLVALDLHDNQISEVPGNLRGASNLQSVNLSMNEIKTFPQQLLNLPSLKLADLRNNPLRPYDLAEQDRKRVAFSVMPGP